MFFIFRMELELWFIPIIGFFIGLGTNYIAVKMLFHPRIKILGIQGVLPKRKEVLAKNIADVAPSIMPPYFQKLEKLPIIGKSVIAAFKRAVENQVNSLSVEEIEEITFRVMKRELNFVIWMGGVLGFLIGLIQMLVVL